MPKGGCPTRWWLAWAADRTRSAPCTDSSARRWPCTEWRRRATDGEALQAFQVLARAEGILCALESAHAVAALKRLPPHEVVVVNLSGRGDKDLATIVEALK